MIDEAPSPSEAPSEPGMQAAAAQAAAAQVRAAPHDHEPAESSPKTTAPAEAAVSQAEAEPPASEPLEAEQRAPATASSLAEPSNALHEAANLATAQPVAALQGAEAPTAPTMSLATPTDTPVDKKVPLAQIAAPSTKAKLSRPQKAALDASMQTLLPFYYQAQRRPSQTAR